MVVVTTKAREPSTFLAVPTAIVVLPVTAASLGSPLIQPSTVLVSKLQIPQRGVFAGVFGQVSGMMPTAQEFTQAFDWQVATALGDAVQVPQVCSPPQPFDTVPQALPEQAVALADGVQPHTFAVPPPLQVCGSVQPPQSWVLLQPFATAPHLPEQAVALTVGTQVHSVGEPLHSSLLAQALQAPASAQPLLRSVGTHLLPHFLVSAPHDPRTQLSP